MIVDEDNQRQSCRRIVPGESAVHYTPDKEGRVPINQGDVGLFWLRH